MSIGKSGRVVIEMDPKLKEELYSALSKENKNLKHWFLENVESFLKNAGQLELSYNNDQLEKGKSTDGV